MKSPEKVIHIHPGKQQEVFGMKAVSISLPPTLTTRKVSTSDLLDFLMKQESPAAADKPARRLRKVCTVYERAVGLL